MSQTAEERAQEASDALTKANQEFADAQRSDAEQTRSDNPDTGETQEEYQERVRLASTTGIFGDTDTTAGAGAVGQDVPSSNNEAATVAVAQADAAAVQDPESDEANASVDEARRQVDVSGAQPSAEQVDEGAPEDNTGDDDGEEGNGPSVEEGTADDDTVAPEGENTEENAS